MELAQFPWLTVTILLPITAALAIPFIPDENGRTIRWYALTVGLIDFVLLVIGFSQGYDLNGSGLQMVESYTWVSQLDLKWSVGADGLSMPLILLTGFISTLAILASWPVTLKPRLFYFLMLAMYSGQLGVFAVQDMLLFFFMWELELIPVYLLLSIWGGKKTPVRCHQVHPLHRWWLSLYPGGRFGHGLLRRHHYLRHAYVGGKGLCR
jgi:NAD(P)H-quinone oxidoreductase subunit 4